jgi:zinc/manganese transport system substrate-binding protein
MYIDLVSIDSSNSLYYKQEYASLNVTIGQYNSRINQIRIKFSGTPVASTESIFEYLANATGVNLVSPKTFMEAVAEGNDPTPQDITIFQDQLQSKTVKILVYNSQTVTPLTEQMKNLAAQNKIPTVAITETIQPPTTTFQTWMSLQLDALYNALYAQASTR